MDSGDSAPAPGQCHSCGAWPGKPHQPYCKEGPSQPSRKSVGFLNLPMPIKDLITSLQTIQNEWPDATAELSPSRSGLFLYSQAYDELRRKDGMDGSYSSSAGLNPILREPGKGMV